MRLPISFLATLPVLAFASGCSNGTATPTTSDGSDLSTGTGAGPSLGDPGIGGDRGSCGNHDAGGHGGNDAGPPTGGDDGGTIDGGAIDGGDGDASSAPDAHFATDFLVFAGAGTWSTEVSDVEALFDAHGATYREVSSAQLDAMSAQDMAQFGVLYIPGGEGQTEADGVSTATHANLRAAVQQLGVSYVGFCAGAFVAVAPAPAPGGDVSYGFGVVDGPVLDYYTGPGSSSDYAMTLESFPDGTTENVLWYGGPVTPSIGVVAEYPTGDPAVSVIRSGNGLVFLGGVHPDLSQASLDALGVTPDTPAQDLAWKILDAARKRQTLPTF